MHVCVCVCVCVCECVFERDGDKMHADGKYPYVIVKGSVWVIWHACAKVKNAFISHCQARVGTYMCRERECRRLCERKNMCVRDSEKKCTCEVVGAKGESAFMCV